MNFIWGHANNIYNFGYSIAGAQYFSPVEKVKPISKKLKKKFGFFKKFSMDQVSK